MSEHAIIDHASASVLRDLLRRLKGHIADMSLNAMLATGRAERNAYNKRIERALHISAEIEQKLKELANG